MFPPEAPTLQPAPDLALTTERKLRLDVLVLAGGDIEKADQMVAWINEEEA